MIENWWCKTIFIIMMMITIGSENIIFMALIKVKMIMLISLIILIKRS